MQRLAIGYENQVLIEGLDFEVRRGSVFAILGRSGSGKSTLLRTLVGLEEPLAGSVTIGDRTGQAGLHEAPRFGVMFQSGALFGSMTLAQNVALPLEKWTALSRSGIAAIVRSKLRLVGLDGFEDYFPSQISGGMKKRAGIARALALEPPLLFMDEPSAGLDPVTAAEMDDLILNLNRNLEMTMVIVTHELRSIFRVAEECIMIARGHHGVLARGRPADLRDHASDPRVRDFFRHHGATEVAR